MSIHPSYLRYLVLNLETNAPPCHPYPPPPPPPPSKTLCPGCSNSDSTIQWINYHPLSCLTVIAMFESATNCTETVTESELQITVLIERNLITKMAMYMDRGKE